MNKSVRNMVIGSLLLTAGITVFAFIKKTNNKKNNIKKEIIKVEEPKEEKVYHLLYEFGNNDKIEKKLEKVI